MRYLVVDIETGGFSKKKNGICEIAFQVLDYDLAVIDTYQTLIKPYPRSKEVQEFKDQLVSYKDDAMAVHGITMEELESEGVDKSTVIEQIYIKMLENDFDDKFAIVAHNLESFDFPWLVEFFKEIDREYGEFGDNFTDRIDTLKLFRQLRGKGTKNDLETLCEVYGIKNNKAHRALSDVKATVDLLRIAKSENLL